MRIRSTILGGLAGLLLLAVVVGFAVGLPELADDDAPASRPAAELLPETLLGGSLVPLGEAVPDLGPANEDQQEQIAARQSQVYDADYAVRYYADSAFEILGSVTVVDLPVGLFQPQGPPVELAEEQDPTGASTQVIYGDVICYETWGSAEQVQSNQAPAAVQCRRGADGRTFDIYVAGLTSADAASALNEVVAHARSVESDQDQ